MSEHNHDRVENGSAGKTRPAASPWRRFWSRFVSEPEPTVAHLLYDRLVQHARFPLYYGKLGVPDTPEGRFEILALHVGLTVRKLASLDDEGRKASQSLFDLMVADLDMNMRELGVGDLSVGKQVKRLAGQFYARLGVLGEAFDDGRMEALRPMLRTNLYGAASPSEDRIEHLVDILVHLREALDRQRPDDLKAGRLELPDEPTLAGLEKRSPAPVPTSETGTSPQGDRPSDART